MNEDEVRMTDDQYEEWQEKIPPWISLRTYKIAAALKMKAEDAGINIGAPMKSERNGDSMWFMLTNGSRSEIIHNGYPRSVQHLSVLLCTPHCILIENNYKGTEVSYSILGDPELYIEHLSNTGMRALTDEEFNRYINGEL